MCICVCLLEFDWPPFIFGENSPGGTGHARWDYNYNTRDALLTLRDSISQWEIKFNWILDDVGITRRPVRSIALTASWLDMYIYVCVCVRERERERTSPLSMCGRMLLSADPILSNNLLPCRLLMILTYRSLFFSSRCFLSPSLILPFVFRLHSVLFHFKELWRCLQTRQTKAMGRRGTKHGIVLSTYSIFSKHRHRDLCIIVPRHSRFFSHSPSQIPSHSKATTTD